MDIGRFVQVAWRFKFLLALGLVLATVVALLSYVRVSFDGGPKVEYRQDQIYLSASTVLVTQAGFPWGRAILDDVIEAPATGEGGQEQVVPRFSDPGRYSGLAALYSQLARADEIVARVKAKSAVTDYYEAETVRSGDGTSMLPLVYIKGYSATAKGAQDVSNRATDEFRRYLEEEQDRNQIAKDKRVEVVVTQRATVAEVFEKRSFVRPVMMFLLISMAFFALAFALENLRGRRQPQMPADWTPEEPLPEVAPQPTRVPEPPHAPREPERSSSAVWSR